MADLLLLGAGKMGTALLAGWHAKGLTDSRVLVVDPGADAASLTAICPHAQLFATPADLPAPAGPEVMIVAIKPQMMTNVLPVYAARLTAESLVVSIAAGTSLATLRTLLGVPDGAGVVRVMPNTPAAVGAGMSVLCTDAPLSDAARTLCTNLMAAVGDAAWIDDETLMHAVTAVSGSGPAYVFHLAECLAEAGVAAGLPADLAARLARATVAGSGVLMAGTDTPPATLRENVTSPGGTTAAALGELRDTGALADLMRRAVAAAAKRSEELS